MNFGLCSFDNSLTLKIKIRSELQWQSRKSFFLEREPLFASKLFFFNQVFLYLPPERSCSEPFGSRCDYQCYGQGVCSRRLYLGCLLVLINLYVCHFMITWWECQVSFFFLNARGQKCVFIVASQQGCVCVGGFEMFGRGLSRKWNFAFSLLHLAFNQNHFQICPRQYQFQPVKYAQIKSDLIGIEPKKKSRRIMLSLKCLELCES